MKKIAVCFAAWGGLALLHLHILSLAAAGGISVGDRLKETQWQWEKSLYNDGTQVVPQHPENYTLTFMGDGVFEGRADCNRIRGQYTLSGDRIAVVGPVISTKAMCPPGSSDLIFLNDLERMAVTFFRGEQLFIDLVQHTGTMSFLPAQHRKLEKQASVKNETVTCTAPRPQACTMEYDPVCGVKKDNSVQSYGNGCQACADPQVTHYLKGECPE